MKITQIIRRLGAEIDLAGSQFGGMATTPEIDEMIARGMGRHMTVGAFSTGITNGTVIDIDQPQFVIGVPGGVCIRPVRVGIQVQTGLLAADDNETESLVAADSLGLWTGDGTLTQENPSNMRTDLAKGSMCKCGSNFTADMTTTPEGGSAADPVLDMELSRYVMHGDVQGTPANANWNYHNHVYQPEHPPFLVGPCSVLGYWGGTVAVIGGFAQVEWVEGRIEDFFK